MKDELQLKLVEILTSIQTAAGKASDFALEQLPDIAQSYLIYGRVLETTLFVLALGIIFWMCWNIPKWYKELESSGDGPAIMFVWAAIVGVGAYVINLLPNLFLVWFAPKVWLLKEIAGLIK